MARFELPMEALGTVKIMPRTIYWFEMPENFKDKDKIELLQKDIWIQSVSIKDLEHISAEEETIFLYNLDSLYRREKSGEGHIVALARTHISHLIRKKPIKTVVHTTHLNPHLKQMFQEKDLVYLEKNLANQKLAISSIATIVNLLYERTGRKNRAYLRLELGENSHIGAEILVIQHTLRSIVSAKVMDLSMNGMLLRFDNEADLEKMELKSLVGVNINLGRQAVKIKTALIVRVDRSKKEAGIYFDSHNSKMMSEDQAGYFSTLMYHWLQNIIEAKE